MLSNTKIYVGKKSKEIQEKAFQLGWGWYGNVVNILNTKKPFLFFSEDNCISASSNLEYFNNHKNKEIDIETLLSYRIDKELIDTYTPQGDIKGFPVEILKRMVECQKEQGNEEDVSAFEKDKNLTKMNKGFNWWETKEGSAFWEAVIGNKKFDYFFKTYPKENTQVFKTFDKVLVRNSKNELWKATFFSHYRKDKGKYKHQCINSNCCYKFCIPFKGNEHLLPGREW